MSYFIENFKVPKLMASRKMSPYQKKVLSSIVAVGLICSIAYAYYYYYIDTPMNIPLNDVEAHRYYQDKHSKSKERVMNYYEKLLKDNPASPYTNYYIARMISDEDINRAEKLANIAIKLDSNFKYGYKLLGHIYCDKGYYAKSFDCINKSKEKGLSKEAVFLDEYWLIGQIFSNVKHEQLEQMISTYYPYGRTIWNSNEISFHDFFYKVNNDLQYLVDNPQCIDSNIAITDKQAMKDGILQVLKYHKSISDKIELDIKLRQLCSESSHENFVKDRFFSLGKNIIQLDLVKKMQECVYMWRVVCITEYGTVSNCNILTGLSDGGNEIAILTANCN